MINDDLHSTRITWQEMTEEEARDTEANDWIDGHCLTCLEPLEDCQCPQHMSMSDLDIDWANQQDDVPY